jgi:hypothetical protein
MTNVIPFNQRFGTGLPDRPLDREVPESARIGLIGILGKLESDGYISSWGTLATEALHTGRRLRKDFEKIGDETLCTDLVMQMGWDRFYIFCERVYRVLQPRQYYDNFEQEFVGMGSLEESQVYFSAELNELLAEENLAYEFVEGIFQRRGRPQTQKSLRRASAVLADPKFSQARNHYNKAVKFFSERPNPDVENCIKEAACALEAFVEILFGKRAAKNFDEAIRSRQGNSEEKIPPTIGESIIKLRAFRGSAKGVAHAAIEGGPVSEVEAELALSLVASYITYLRDKFPPKEEEIPF